MRKIPTITVSHQLKSCHLTTHDINRQERKCLLAKAHFSVLSSQPEQALLQSDSTPGQCEYTVPETTSYSEQRQLPNPTSDENEDELIPCLCDSCISYEGVCGTNLPVMDYDIFKLYHPFSMLVAGPRGAGKSEFVEQLLSLKRYIMMDPPDRIVWFYGEHQPDLFCSLTQKIPSIEFFHEGLPTNIEARYSFALGLDDDKSDSSYHGQ